MEGSKMKYKSLLKVFFLMVASGSLLSAMAGGEPVKVFIKEWEVPTPNSRPHDPAIGPDGSLWYTGQQSNTIGVLDPRTEKIREYRLKTPDSGPHGLVADKEGAIWFTAIYKGYIGKLNPVTGEVIEYPISNPAGARDPHTPVFDQKGILWFTAERGNFVGRLDPRTGDIKLKPSPTPNSIPYGITVNSKGIPFYCEFGTNKLAVISPDTLEISEYLLPQGARPRRLAITADDRIYYTDFSRGYLGRFDPKVGKVEEWASPGGSKSQPYAIAATPDGMIWYSESGVKPNTIVRFDPATKRFDSWPISSGGGVVRNMVSTPGGNLYIACSGVNKIGIVYIER
jgi:virginiamycin B lyase